MEAFLASISAIFPWLILVFMLLSLFSLVVPVFPGGVVIWLLALIYGWLSPEHFSNGGTWIFVLITILMLASAAADNILMGTKAKEAGASWRGIIIALVAGAVGAIVLTPIGGLVLAALSLYLVEYIRLRDSDQALTITKGLMMGCGWSFIVRFGLGIGKIILWAIWAF